MALSQISDTIQTFTAYANENISAGMFVKAGSLSSHTNGVTSAGVSSYAATDIIAMKCDASGDGLLAIGIAMETATSGNNLQVGTEGLFVLPSDAAVLAGTALRLTHNADAFANSVGPYTTPAADDGYGLGVGRALTGTSASGNYLIATIRI